MCYKISHAVSYLSSDCHSFPATKGPQVRFEGYIIYWMVQGIRIGGSRTAYIGIMIVWDMRLDIFSGVLMGHQKGGHFR